MALLDDLKSQTGTIFKEKWSNRDGRVVPEPTDLALSNDAVSFERATVLYADLTGSTTLVDSKSWQFAGEVYKSYLYCAAKLIRAEDGQITSYDGDRVMGIFIGELQSTRAVRCALRINWAVQNIINPALKTQYPQANYTVRQVIGIDTSALSAARTGVRGGNDIVWIGRAANHAAKLTALKNDGPTWITADVYKMIADDAKFGGSPRRDMWTKYTWNAMNKVEIYASNFWWSIT